MEIPNEEFLSASFNSLQFLLDSFSFLLFLLDSFSSLQFLLSSLDSLQFIGFYWIVLIPCGSSPLVLNDSVELVRFGHWALSLQFVLTA